MKATIIVGGKEITVDVSEGRLKEIMGLSDKDFKRKRTGYERVEKHDEYYQVFANGCVDVYDEECCEYDNDSYYVANYYSDEDVAKNNERADKLMRRLRRFAVENRERDADWCDITRTVFFISYSHSLNKLIYTGYNGSTQDYGGIYFDSLRAVESAMEMFREELIWYFTEYKDSAC